MKSVLDENGLEEAVVPGGMMVRKTRQEHKEPEAWSLSCSTSLAATQWMSVVRNSKDAGQGQTQLTMNKTRHNKMTGQDN